MNETPVVTARADEPMLRFFAHAHLPFGLMRDTSAGFAALAESVVDELPRTPERTVALRKLLEAKDAAVRCALESPEVSS